MTQSAEPSPGTAPVSLGTPIQYLKGVGPEKARLLEKLGLRSAADILFFFPRDYEYPSPLVPIGQLIEDTPASVSGRVAEIETRVTHNGKHILGVLIEDEQGSAARMVFFNQPFRVDQLQRDQRVLVDGRPKLSGLRMEFTHPKLTMLGEDAATTDKEILPVYRLTEGIQQPLVRRVAAAVVDELADQLVDVLPEEILREYGIREIAFSIREIHTPTSDETLAAARRRLVFQELFVLQLALAIRRRSQTLSLKAPQLPVDAAINARILKRFPFQLTSDQLRAFEEVAEDMKRSYPMNRLVQGDVGSGKTVVAQYAMLLSVANRHQAVLMAPTEILAQQHHETFRNALSHSRVRLGLLTGSLSALDRRELLKSVADGEIDLLVGTQALLSEDVQFQQLGLVVIDEQHKFGVQQRAGLRRGNQSPHYLVLSATPIPRTVAMAVFGDLDVSTLKEKPPGRSTVKTYLAKDDWKDRWWGFVSDRLREGRQAYVVAPRVDADEDGVASTQQVFDQLREGPLKKFRIDQLHGRMSTEEKTETMRRFASGRLQVLVTTSVIEVGIDVPNATVMTILGANRFGLAQLHQLRGRVWRGSHTGYVCVFTDEEDSAIDDERMRVFAETSDGFELAESDYRLRGPGDLFGVRQSGMPPLKIADPLRDAELLELARRASLQLIEKDPLLDAPELSTLKTRLLRRYGQCLELSDVG